MHRTGWRHRLVALATALMIAGVIAGCTGDDKPGYCSALSDVQHSIEDLRIGDGGASDVRAQLTTIEDQIKTLVSEVKSEYAAEAKAIESAVAALKTAIGKLPSPPTAQSLAGLQPAAQGVVDAVTGLADATTSTC